MVALATMVPLGCAAAICALKGNCTDAPGSRIAGSDPTAWLLPPGNWTESDSADAGA